MRSVVLVSYGKSNKKIYFDEPLEVPASITEAFDLVGPIECIIQAYDNDFEDWVDIDPINIQPINVQSLLSTFDAFSLMMNTYNFDIVALSETWLKESHHLQNYVQINGYNATFKNRENKKGGGVGLYIKDHLKYTVRHDLSKIDETLEILWV